MKTKRITLAICLIIILGLMVTPPLWRFELSRVNTLGNDESERRSITFILGEDKVNKTYFADAAEYFQSDSIEATDEVISSCKTLDCVIETLNALKQSEPWGLINIVAHGNPQTGLNVYLSMDGHKATPKRMVQETLLRNLPRIASHSVDSTTSINVWSCGIGKSPMINFALPLIFSDKLGNRPDVYCSPYFVIFEPDSNGIMRKLNASYWPYYFKRGYRPSQSEIATQMASQFPEERKDWDNLSEEVRTLDYHIPVSFTKYYSDKAHRPDLSTKEAKMAFIDNEPKVLELIAESGIPREKFEWKVEKRYELDESGNPRYFVKVLGMSTVLCFLEIAS